MFRGQNVGIKLLQEALIEARAGREVVFEEWVENPWIAKGKTKETMCNFFDMKTRYVGDTLRKSSRDSAATSPQKKPNSSGKPTGTPSPPAGLLSKCIHFGCHVLHTGVSRRVRRATSSATRRIPSAAPIRSSTTPTGWPGFKPIAASFATA